MDLHDAETSRKAQGVYYTPPALVDHLIHHTVGQWLQGRSPDDAKRLTILDPACGSGLLLLGAYRYLLNRPGRCQSAEHLSPASLQDCIFGVDIDPKAVAMTRQSLQQEMASGARPISIEPLPRLSANIRCGNALIAPDFLGSDGYSNQPRQFDWEAEFPSILQAGGFDVVIGNPPWGQKKIRDRPEEIQYLRQRFPSIAGIYDMFRPFVELGIRLTRPGGIFGMVLPDIILLKNYASTRRFLLDQLTIQAIDWWGMAFGDAIIDTVTIVGTRVRACPGHSTRVTVHDPARPMAHAIPQADFQANPRQAFNLFLTPEKRAVIARLADGPALGDFFEIHEGVHSGNLRAELFVSSRVDESCRELIFGRDEIRPYRLSWQGRFVRLSVVPSRKTRDRYANVGQPHWHERPKLLVRRTGDRVIAAVDRGPRYASNNFFLVFPRQQHPLDLNGLCALLNSRFMTWYFRTIEPRQGRAFAELKIKHLRTFPVPTPQERKLCEALNELGAQRSTTTGIQLDAGIDTLVWQLLGVNEQVVNYS